MTAIQMMTINTGSSSLKAALYQVGPPEQLDLAVNAERIGQDGGRLRIRDARGEIVLDQKGDLPDYAAALQAWFSWLQRQGLDKDLAAVGHRVVHGGSQYREPCRITPDVTAALQALVPIDPEHLPQALGAMAAVSQAYPAIPQVACFDTAFHRQMPRVAQMFALPRTLWDAGVLRLGFHGLSYEYIMQKLRAEDPVAADGRVVIAHLGNGASMAAVRAGSGVDTTMGFTPTGGLMMGTRSGDLDPGVLLHLMSTKGLDARALDRVVNHEAGLVGVSETTNDMRALLAARATDPRAALAVEMFCYHARKTIGALVAALGGLEMLVFTGGIGEHAAPIRAQICESLAHLGLIIDAERNAAHARSIASDGARCRALVVPTDEERQVAHHTQRVIEGRAE